MNTEELITNILQTLQLPNIIYYQTNYDSHAGDPPKTTYDYWVLLRIPTKQITMLPKPIRKQPKMLILDTPDHDYTKLDIRLLKLTINIQEATIHIEGQLIGTDILPPHTITLADPNSIDDVKQYIQTILNHLYPQTQPHITITPLTQQTPSLGSRTPKTPP
jgi:hypothetical protein